MKEIGVSYERMNELIIARTEKEYWENQRAKNKYSEKNSQESNREYSIKSINKKL